MATRQDQLKVPASAELQDARASHIELALDKSDAQLVRPV
jgi:hypothetical protein